MSGLIAGIEEVAGSSTFVDMATRKTNTSGTPLVSATANDDGRAIADTYALTFTSVVASTSATVKTLPGFGKNPYLDQTGVSVLLDGTTVYDNIIGGVDLVFSASGSFSGTWTAQVRVGLSFGELNAFAPDAGVPTDSRRIQVTNTGADVGSSCKARLITVAKRFATIGTVFERTRPFAESATETQESDGKITALVATVANVAGSGSSKTMDLSIDGDLITCVNLTTLETVESTDLNVTDYYEISDGDLESLVFILSEDAVNGDTERILIFEPRFTQIAPDLSGAPGTWGTSDVDLTETGQSTGGITASGLAYFHTRLIVPESGNTKSNPYPCNVALEGSDAGGAGWSS